MTVVRLCIAVACLAAASFAVSAQAAEPSAAGEVTATSYTGSDIGAQINAAVAACANQCTIRVPKGSHRFSTAINLANRSQIRLTGTSPGNYAGAGSGSALIWTGGAGSGPAIKAPGATALEIDHINVSYSNASYDGNLLSLSSTGGAMNTANVHVHHVRLGGGGGGAVKAARLIELDTSLGVVIEQSFFGNANVAIGATGTSNNMITIRDNWFDNTVGAHIVPWGANWNVENNIFESRPGRGGIVPALRLDRSGRLSGLRFEGNLMIDGGSGAGIHVDLAAQTVAGASIRANVFSAASGTGIRLGAGSSGVEISANAFSGMNLGIDLGSANGVVITGNSFGPLGTGWSGTAPTRVVMHSNTYVAVPVRGGIPVPNNASIGLTPAGSSEDGAGMLTVFVREDNAQAIYMLNGAAGTATEIADPGGIFGSNAGTDGSINIYWNAKTSRYELENRRGTQRTVTVNAYFR
jgi:hypothetical protein